MRENMSIRNIARRVEALEVKSGLAGAIKEALDGFDALKNELSPLLCPVCRAQWEELDQLPDSERMVICESHLSARRYMEVIMACPGEAFAGPQKNSCRRRVAARCYELVEGGHK